MVKNRRIRSRDTAFGISVESWGPNQTWRFRCRRLTGIFNVGYSNKHPGDHLAGRRNGLIDCRNLSGNRRNDFLNRGSAIKNRGEGFLNRVCVKINQGDSFLNRGGGRINRGDDFFNRWNSLPNRWNNLIDCWNEFINRRNDFSNLQSRFRGFGGYFKDSPGQTVNCNAGLSKSPFEGRCLGDYATNAGEMATYLYGSVSTTDNLLENSGAVIQSIFISIDGKTVQSGCTAQFIYCDGTNLNQDPGAGSATITQYDTVGGRIKGTFSGTMGGKSITGSFNVKRYADGAINSYLGEWRLAIADRVVLSMVDWYFRGGIDENIDARLSFYEKFSGFLMGLFLVKETAWWRHFSLVYNNCQHPLVLHLWSPYHSRGNSTSSQFSS